MRADAELACRWLASLHLAPQTPQASPGESHPGPHQGLQDHSTCALLCTLGVRGPEAVRAAALKAMRALVAGRADLGVTLLPCLVAVLQRVVSTSGEWPSIGMMMQPQRAVSASLQAMF